MKAYNGLKRAASALLIVGMVFTMLPQAVTNTYAMTDLTMDEYDDIVSTYSVNDSVPDYKDYVNQFDAVYPSQSAQRTASVMMRAMFRQSRSSIRITRECPVTVFIPARIHW